VGVDFDERFSRLDESVKVLRRLLQPDSPDFKGRFYTSEGFTIAPRPARLGGVPIWIGSWGSEAGMRRVARLADGWLASAYNTTPALFAEGWRLLQGLLDSAGRDPFRYPIALATTMLYLSDDAGEAEDVLRDLVAPALNREPDYLRDRLLIGSAAQAIEKLMGFQQAGLQEVYLWPVKDEVAQLEHFMAEVAPKII
jgi:alkanesulfonate monooxygenase SsuD/methylene tetrahydromethanopterin reductase-like flavin-dependent oxidoreductase (luciferase family)